MLDDFDTLVVSGGSTKGICALGGIQYLYDSNILQKITNFIGTSVGSMICYLIVIGFSPQEILAYLCSKQLLEKMQHFNLVAMINGAGASTFIHIQEQLEKMSISKIGFLPTFQDIFITFGKVLVFPTFNISSSTTEYLSKDTYPNLSCITAIRMSANIPFVFEDFKYGNSYYIDGSISNNFPIEIGEQLGTNILGIYIQTTNETNLSKNGFIEYIFILLSTLILSCDNIKIDNKGPRTTIVRLNCESNFNFLQFNLDTKSKLELFSNGYMQIRDRIS